MPCWQIKYKWDLDWTMCRQNHIALLLAPVLTHEHVPNIIFCKHLPSKFKLLS